MARIVTLHRWEIRFWIFRIEINELQPRDEQRAVQTEKPDSPSGIPQTVKKGDSHEKE